MIKTEIFMPLSACFRADITAWTIVYSYFIWWKYKNNRYWKGSFQRIWLSEKSCYPQRHLWNQGWRIKDSKNITEIYIAPSVNKIAKTAFDGIDNLTIYAEKGSYAEKFAVENKINYKNYTTEPENPEAKNTDYSKIRNGAYYGEYLIMMLSMMTASPCA